MSASFPATPSTRKEVLSVSQLARRARLLIEGQLGAVDVEGELSNFRQPGSGHWYFTLKDQGAQIRCAMFAGRNRLVQLAVRDGLQVRVSGRLSLYEARGDFQLIVDRMEAAGEGALRAAFEAMKEKLAAEGLFDESRKRPLPDHPRHLTIISSASGAALRDVLHVVERRFPGLQVTLIPSAVQGDGAEAQLLQALAQAARIQTDVVLLTRGGGSLEDLWAFNLEPVARAVAACPHPVVSAIGHQTDFAMTDFVADARAPTPSAAAEMITPTREDLAALVQGHYARIVRSLNQELRFKSQTIVTFERRLTDPATQIAQRMVQVDDIEGRLQRAWQQRSGTHRARIANVRRALSLLAPARQIGTQTQTLTSLSGRLGEGLKRNLNEQHLALASHARALSAVSPLNTLNRGYAVLMKTSDDGPDSPISSISQTAGGDSVRALLADGGLTLTVTAVDSEPPLSTPDLATPDLATPELASPDKNGDA